jgi:hypothetical protein
LGVVVTERKLDIPLVVERIVTAVANVLLLLLGRSYWSLVPNLFELVGGDG